MRLLSLILAINVAINAAADEFPLTLLEKHSVQASSSISEKSLMVGRLGITDIVPATFIARDVILSPKLKGIDEQDAPYLLYQANGQRLRLESLASHSRHPFVLLKIPESFAMRGLPSRAMDDYFKKSPWLLPAHLPPTLRLGTTPAATITALQFQPDAGASSVAVEAVAMKPGIAVFSLQGALAGFVTRSSEDSSSILHVSKLLSTWPDFEKQASLIVEEAEAPALPATPPVPKDELEGAQKNSGLMSALAEAFRLPASGEAPYGLLRNSGKAPVHSAIGLIIDDGLVISKASELSGELSFTHGGLTLPAALLAVDDASDLALVAVSHPNLPIAELSPSLPEKGALLFSPVLLDYSDSTVTSDRPVAVGLSLGSQASIPDLHATERYSSLGLIPEQGESSLVVAAILPGSPAANSGLMHGDTLVALGDRRLSSRADLVAALASHAPGEKAKIAFVRKGKESEAEITLAPASPLPSLNGFESMQSLTQLSSVWRDELPPGLLHSTPLNPWDCGGPLYNSAGELVGLNIASLGKGASLALPAAELRRAIGALRKRTKTF